MIVLSSGPTFSDPIYDRSSISIAITVNLRAEIVKYCVYSLQSIPCDSRADIPLTEESKSHFFGRARPTCLDRTPAVLETCPPEYISLQAVRKRLQNP